MYQRMSKGYLEPLVIIIFIIFIFFIFGVTFVHANLCMHILASTFKMAAIHFRLLDFRL